MKFRKRSTQSQDYEVSEKGASTSFSNVCYHVFFNRASNRKIITLPHSSPSLLFASLLKILKIDVLTGRSVKAIPVGEKNIRIKKTKDFFPYLPTSLTCY